MAKTDAQGIEGTAIGNVAGRWPPGRFVSQPLQHALRISHFQESASQIGPADRSKVGPQSLALPHRQVMIPQDEVTSQRSTDPLQDLGNPIEGARVIDPIARNHQAIGLMLLKLFKSRAIEFHRYHAGQMQVRNMPDAQTIPAKR